MTGTKSHYVVTFRDSQEKEPVSMRVRKIEDSTLGPTFITLSGFIFEEGNLIIDPSEEDRRKRFENTRRLHLSLFHILSVEEVGPRVRKLDLVSDRTNLVILPEPTKR